MLSRHGQHQREKRPMIIEQEEFQKKLKRINLAYFSDPDRIIAISRGNSVVRQGEQNKRLYLILSATSLKKTRKQLPLPTKSTRRSGPVPETIWECRVSFPDGSAAPPISLRKLIWNWPISTPPPLPWTWNTTARSWHSLFPPLSMNWRRAIPASLTALRKRKKRCGCSTVLKWPPPWGNYPPE